MAYEGLVKSGFVVLREDVNHFQQAGYVPLLRKP